MTGLSSLLVHVDGGSGDDDCVSWASVVARQLDARLTGMYLTSAPPVTPSVAALLPDNVIDLRLAEASAARDHAERRFRHVATSRGLENLGWCAPAGAPFGAAVEHARCADCVVLGQPDASAPTAAFRETLVHDVVVDGARPVILMPYIGSKARHPSNVLVAWDGGRAASRAIGDALPLLARAERVTVISYRTGDANEVGDVLRESRLANYLGAHGIDAVFMHDRYQEAEIADALLSRTADLGVDLLVMGGFSHSRLHERVFGGVTRAILHAMPIPVLMSH